MTFGEAAKIINRGRHYISDWRANPYKESVEKTEFRAEQIKDIADIRLKLRERFKTTIYTDKHLTEEEIIFLNASGWDVKETVNAEKSFGCQQVTIELFER